MQMRFRNANTTSLNNSVGLLRKITEFSPKFYKKFKFKKKTSEWGTKPRSSCWWDFIRGGGPRHYIYTWSLAWRERLHQWTPWIFQDNGPDLLYNRYPVLSNREWHAGLREKKRKPRRLLVGVVRARKFLTFTLYLFFCNSPIAVVP